MKIIDLNIEGFGVWHNLDLPKISSKLTAFYGANEAGKTTLMQFVRGILYGISPERRQRYLPPQEGARPGGSMTIDDSGQHFNVMRIADRGPNDIGRVTITSRGNQVSSIDSQDAGNPISGDRLLRETLGEVDEPTFNNLFAIGLGEIQRLATLSGTQAAQSLYRLTSGLDRVSLFDIIQGLRESRHRLIHQIIPQPAPTTTATKPIELQSAQATPLTALVTQRNRLRARIDELKEQNRQWSHWSVQLEEFDGQIEATEALLNERQHAARTIEIAVGLKTNWRRRAKLSHLIQQHQGATLLPENAIDRLETYQEKLASHQREADILQGQRSQLSDETENLGINQHLVQHASRIDALGEQRDWLQALERQAERLTEEAEESQQRLTNEQARLSSSLGISDNPTALRTLSERDLKNLRPQIQALQRTQQQVDQAQQQLADLSQNEQSLQLQLESTSTSGEQHGLPMDVQETSDLVANLRKRLQVEQRIEQAQAHMVEMEGQSHELLDEQVMPLWLFGLLLSVFVLGALMIGLWLIVPSSPLGQYGGLFALLGISGAGFSWMFKFFAEDAAADRLDACHRQIDIAEKQLQDGLREKEKLNSNLSLVDGSVVLRLQAAERHLETLENLLPVATERKVASHEASGARQRLQMAQQKYDQNLEEWKTKMVALGLPPKLDHRLLTDVTDRYGKLSILEQHVQTRQQEVEDRQREHALLTRRIHALAEEVECVLDDATGASREVRVEEVEDPTVTSVSQLAPCASPLDQLDHLLSARRQQLSRVERRKELWQRAKVLKAEEGQHRRAVEGLKKRQTALFHAADCEDETEYRQLFEQQRKVARQRKQRKAITREIMAAIGQQETEETFANLLRPQVIDSLESLWESKAAELEASQEKLKQLIGQRAEVKQHLRTLVEDRSLAEAILDLDCVEQQIAAARDRWREHATVSRLLERIRNDYEAHRQPEALHEASTLLSRMTAGKYQRIWTPLANDILLVETSSGQSLPVEALSRGTREQLLLCVRLALVTLMARRGVKLPMVLDDVLVNFDAVRAKRAAEVLMEFAVAGHQVLLFTCHEHMWQMFHELKADCRRLPQRDTEETQDVAVAMPEPEPEPEPIVEIKEIEPDMTPLPLAPPLQVKKKKKRKKTPPPEVVVQEPEIIEPSIPDNEFSYEWTYELSTPPEPNRSVPAEPIEMGEPVLAYVMPEEDHEYSHRKSTRTRQA